MGRLAQTAALCGTERLAGARSDRPLLVQGGSDGRPSSWGDKTSGMQVEMLEMEGLEPTP
jgi:hypothetical protein